MGGGESWERRERMMEGGRMILEVKDIIERSSMD